MKKSVSCLQVFIMLLTGIHAVAGIPPNGDDIAPIAALLGASSAEDLDSETVELYSHFLRHPLPINRATEQELAGSGLLSPYQCASLADYISTSGSILSISELALVDGFGRDFAEALSPFISLAPPSSGGLSTRRNIPFRHSGLIKANSKLSGDSFSGWGCAGKWRTLIGNNGEVSAGISCVGPSQSPLPSAFSLSGAVYGQKLPWKLLIGDFKARIGQGLSLWSAMTMSGFGTSESFGRRPYGFTPSFSYTGSGTLTGVASDMRVGRLLLRMAAGCEGVHEAVLGKKNATMGFVPALSSTWLGRHSETSLNFCGRFAMKLPGAAGSPPADFAKLSADTRVTLGTAVLSGELCHDFCSGTSAVTAGTKLKIAGRYDLVLNVRSYPSGFPSDMTGAVRSSSSCAGEHGAAAGLGFRAGKRLNLPGPDGLSANVHSGFFSVDAACFDSKKYKWQVKAKAGYELRPSPEWLVSFKAAGRFRDVVEPLRVEARVQAERRWGAWIFKMRADLSKCFSYGSMFLADVMWKNGRSSVNMRTGVFFIDNWSDRIYVYEPDAPGSFNVPAMYGRGAWGAVNAGIRLCRSLKLWARCSYTGYFPDREGQSKGTVMTKEKPGKAELKILVEVDL
ncbi:MAG: hypothetical protein ACI4TM_07615 [Candidatus Cryptobacteroides sp.]